MATESKRKNNDYSATAINLINPPEIKAKLAELHAAQSNVAQLDAVLQAMPEYEDMKRFEEKVVNLNLEIHVMIDALGSYQDTEGGEYALKQRKISKAYDAARFKANYEKLAPAVIMETVNVKALEGLIKGGLVTEQDLDTHNVIIKTESFAYIIK